MHFSLYNCQTGPVLLHITEVRLNDPLSLEYTLQFDLLVYVAGGASLILTIC